MAGERCHFADRYLPGTEIEAVHRTLPSESLFNVNEDPNVSDLEQVWSIHIHHYWWDYFGECVRERGDETRQAYNVM